MKKINHHNYDHNNKIRFLPSVRVSKLMWVLDQYGKRAIKLIFAALTEQVFFKFELKTT